MGVLDEVLQHAHSPFRLPTTKAINADRNCRPQQMHATTSPARCGIEIASETPRLLRVAKD